MSTLSLKVKARRPTWLRARIASVSASSRSTNWTLEASVMPLLRVVRRRELVGRAAESGKLIRFDPSGAPVLVGVEEPGVERHVGADVGIGLGQAELPVDPEDDLR